MPRRPEVRGSTATRVEEGRGSDDGREYVEHDGLGSTARPASRNSTAAISAGTRRLSGGEQELGHAVPSDDDLGEAARRSPT